MTIYEVFYFNSESGNSEDNSFQYNFDVKRPVKYFDTIDKARNFINDNLDKDYYYQGIEVN